MNVLCVSVLISLSVLQYAIVWREKNFIASFYYVFMKVQLFHSFIPLKAENVWCDKAKIKHNTFEIINSTERAHRIDWWTMQRKTPDVSMKDVCVHSSDDFCLCLQVERLNITKMICILCATSMVKLQCVQRVPIIIYWRTFCCWVFFSCVCAVSTFFSFYLNFFFPSFYWTTASAFFFTIAIIIYVFIRLFTIKHFNSWRWIINRHYTQSRALLPFRLIVSKDLCTSCKS